MLAWLRRLVDSGVEAPALTEGDAKHVWVTNLVGLALFASNVWWVPVNLAAGVHWNAAENLAISLLPLLALPLNRRRRHGTATALVLVCAHFQLAWALYWFGVPSGSATFYPALLVASYAATMPRHRRGAHVSALLSLVGMVVAVVLATQLPVRVELMPVRQQEISNAAVAAALLLILAGSFAATVDRAEAAVAAARERVEALLRNVLPEAVARRLEADPEGRIAERFDEVTILFADLVGFTPMSTRVPPAEMVDLLNEIFSAFDEICDREGVEKIRTIGDGYMAVAGAPEPREDHALAMTRVALAIREHIRLRSEESEEALAVRIGLNSGEVVAGIVGKRRFHYDLWGDAVNVAARMESLGEPGRIHVARPTWERIRDQVPCTARGTLEVKGKGPMETWFVD